MLPRTRDGLDLHTARANYQTEIWLHADQDDFVAASAVDTATWKKNDGYLEIVWTR